MDPICHTLVGASLAATGLKDRTRFGTATLLIAANLPDIDVAAHFWGSVASYEFRRGWTHGLPAMVVLPLLLTLLMLVVDRTFASRRAPPAQPRWLLILSFVGIATHPALDWLNNYGMRWLMPLADRWFYGDTLFIIDFVAWTLLAVGLVATRFVDRRALPVARRPATLALTALLAYIGLNFAITRYAEGVVRDEFAAMPPQSFMASPVPLNPFRRDVVLEYHDEYRFVSVHALGGPRLVRDGPPLAKGPGSALAHAAQTDDGAVFLHWARFPYAVVDGGTAVRLADARYVRDIDNPRLDGFAVIELDAPSAVATTD